MTTELTGPPPPLDPPDIARRQAPPVRRTSQYVMARDGIRRGIFAPSGIRSNWFIHDWGELVRAKDENGEGVPSSGRAPVWRVQRNRGHRSRIVLPALSGQHA